MYLALKSALTIMRRPEGAPILHSVPYHIRPVSEYMVVVLNERSNHSKTPGFD